MRLLKLKHRSVGGGVTVSNSRCVRDRMALSTRDQNPDDDPARSVGRMHGSHAVCGTYRRRDYSWRLSGPLEADRWRLREPDEAKPEADLAEDRRSSGCIGIDKAAVAATAGRIDPSIRYSFGPSKTYCLWFGCRDSSLPVVGTAANEFNLF